MKLTVALLSTWIMFPNLAPAEASKGDWLDLARRGWSYELRTTMIGRDMSIPVRIHGRAHVGATICVIGEAPLKPTREVIDTFRALVHLAYGKPLPMRYAGPGAKNCGTGRSVFLRLYSGDPPNHDLSDDLDWMSQVYGLGLPRGRTHVATSPALAQTFFGHQGQVTHIMVQQPKRAVLEPLDTAFFRSILIEELFQSFTFGMDVLQFDREAEFQSKLQEMPLNMLRLPWGSTAFKKALLRSNPSGLCAFDIFMMFAVAETPAEETNTPEFISFIDAEFERLVDLAEDVMGNPRYGLLLDPDCRPQSD